MHAVLTAMIKAHEIQGVLALENSFNRVGLDHVVLVKVASTAVVAQMLGLTRDEIIERGLARLGRRPVAAHLPPRAQHRLAQELGGGRRDRPRGAPRADGARGRDGLSLGADRQDLGLLRRAVQGQAAQVLSRPYGSYVMENVLFKISFPAEFHAQTAVECAMALHPQVDDATRRDPPITIRTHESAIRIIDKKGPLANPADRDHCIQYMVAVPLIFGRLTAADYEDSVAADPRIDALRARMECVEDKQFSQGLPRPGQALDRQRHHASNSRTAASSTKSSSSIRSAIAAGAGKASRCWWRSSRPTWRAAFPPSNSRRSLSLRRTPSASLPRAVHAFVDLFVI